VSSLTKGKIAASRQVHLDPDLRIGALPRGPEWRPSFGQVSGAQGCLRNERVGCGDLFLFYGWFQRVAPDGCGGMRFVRGAPHLHAIFGWLQIGEVLAVGERHEEFRQRYPWLSQHPHMNSHFCPENTIYIASDRLRINGRDMGVAGGGMFDRFDDARCLTAMGETSRSFWGLPGWMLPAGGPNLSGNPTLAKWTRKDDGSVILKSSRPQEAVMDCSGLLSELTDWVTGILAGTGQARRCNKPPRREARTLWPVRLSGTEK